MSKGYTLLNYFQHKQTKKKKKVDQNLQNLKDQPIPIDKALLQLLIKIFL